MIEPILQENKVTMPIDLPIDEEIQAMVRSGVHIGHIRSKNHPSMKPYIFGIRNNISIVDLVLTKEKLAGALEFLKEIASRGGLILFVGTQPAARTAVLNIVEKTKMPYFLERWIGGTLTNFKVISKRVEYMETLEREKETGGFDKYTKKERMARDEMLQRMKMHFDGLRTLRRLPDAVFVVDVTKEVTAIREARKMHIPLVALVDTNSNANLVEYPIPSNDNALPAVRYILERVRTAIEDGKKMSDEKETDKKKEPAA